MVPQYRHRTRRSYRFACPKALPAFLTNQKWHLSSCQVVETIMPQNFVVDICNNTRNIELENLNFRLII